MNYAVVWRENAGPLYAGRAELSTRALVLAGAAPGGLVSVRRLLFEEIRQVRFGRSQAERLGGRTTLLLELDDGATKIAPLGGAGALHELADDLARQSGKAAA